LSGKWTAYSLGLSESSVSEALSSAACKFGVSSRTRLVAIAAELVRGDEARDPDVAFTGAEHDVLAMVAHGMSNEAIARARGRSVRTIANQVAALLRKTGAGSRRSLAAIALRVERSAHADDTRSTA
jgi:DNA-binding CsgD family transcriptional regulator